MIAFLAEGELPAGNWLSATVPFMGRTEIAAVVMPRMAPHAGSRRERAAAAIVESRLGGGSLYFRFTPGNLRYVRDYPARSLVVRREPFLALDRLDRLDDLVAALSAQGDEVLYTPETVLVAPPPPLFVPHLDWSWDYGRRRSRDVRRYGLRALRSTTLLPLLLAGFLVRRTGVAARRRPAGAGVAARPGALSARPGGSRHDRRIPLSGRARRRPDRGGHRRPARLLRGRVRARSRRPLMRLLLLNWRDIREPARGRRRAPDARDRQAARRAGSRGHVVHVSPLGRRRERRRSTASQVVRRGSELTTRLHAPSFARRGTFDLVVEQINTLPYFAPLWSRAPTVVHVNQLAREVWWYEAPKALAAIGYVRRAPLPPGVPTNASDHDLRLDRRAICAVSGSRRRVDVIPMAVNTEPIDELPPKRLEGRLVAIGRLHRVEALRPRDRGACAPPEVAPAARR